MPQTSAKQMLAGSRVSFKCDNLSIQEAVEQFEDAINFQLTPFEDQGEITGKKRITFSDQNVSMMTVVRHLCEKGDLLISRQNSRTSASLILTTQDAMSECTFFPRQTDLSVLPVITRMNVYGASQRVEKRLTAEVYLVAEPKVYLVGYYKGSVLESAMDDQNRSMLPDLRSGMLMRPKSPITYISDGQAQITYSMKYPSAPSTAIKSIRASLKLVMGMNVQSRDLSSALTPGKTASLPFMKNDSVTFSDFEKDLKFPSRFVMTMTVPRVRLAGGVSVEDSAEFAQLRFEATDADKRRWRVHKMTPHVNQSGPVVLHAAVLRPARSEDAKPPVKFSVLIPGRTEEVVMPFEFNDVHCRRRRSRRRLLPGLSFPHCATDPTC